MRARWVAITQARTTVAVSASRPVTASPSTSAAQTQAEHRLGELELADPRHPAAGEPRVPGEEAQEHRDQRHDRRMPSQAVVVACGRSPALSAATGTVSGRASTSAQQIVRAPPSSRATTPPSA